ncbi:synaptonemal complex protein 1-like [Anneissia japonica]|uniref:synaptonemal complex protein 1-like n=1 Tax=Anneissia japonica TaxID=1529436 RepID=UPI0014258BB6|nr:synaptonemal complex protein 1-like [Anneissia japonica]
MKLKIVTWVISIEITTTHKYKNTLFLGPISFNPCCREISLLYHLPLSKKNGIPLLLSQKKRNPHDDDDAAAARRLGNSEISLVRSLVPTTFDRLRCYCALFRYFRRREEGGKKRKTKTRSRSTAAKGGWTFISVLIPEIEKMLQSSSRTVVESDSVPFFKTQMSPSSTMISSQQSSFFTLNSKEHVATSATSSIFQQETPLIQANTQNSQHIQHSRQPTLRHNARQQQQKHGTVEESSEKLGSLHSKLHQEADKIRKWKVDIEMDVKYKERKLTECQQTIESQRKSILELQLQNENLSQKLQLEIDNQCDISQKIESTRSMCNILKDYTNKVEERLSLCEKDKAVLQLQEQERMEQCEDLEERFKSLSLVHVDKVNNLNIQLELEEKQHTDAIEKYQEKLEDLDNEIKVLSNNCEEKNNMIDVLNEKVNERQLTIIDVQTEKESLQKMLSEAKSELATKVQQVEILTLNMQESQKQKEELIFEKTKIEDDVRDLQEREAELSNTIRELSGNLETEGKKNSLLEENSAAIKTEMTKEKIKLEEEISRLNEELKKANNEKQQNILTIEKYREEQLILEKKILNANDEGQDLIRQKEKLQVEIQECRQAIEKKEIELCSGTKELKDALEREKVSYDRIDSLKKELEQISTEKSVLDSSLNTLKDEREDLEAKLKAEIQLTAELENNIADLERSKKKSEKNLKAALKESDELRENVSNLDTSIHEHSKTNEKLQEQTSLNKALQSELDSTSKQIKILEKKNETLENQLATKSKQVKNLQQETKTLKSKVTSQTKQSNSLEKKISTTEETCEKYHVENEDLLRKISEIEKILQEKEEMIEATKVKHNELEAKMQQTIQEHTEAKMSCEKERAEVSNTLIVYKMENENIVSRKDKEIEKLHKEITLLTKAKNDQLSSLQNSFKEQKQELEKVSKDYNNALKESENDKKRITDLIEKQLQEEKDIVALKPNSKKNPTKINLPGTPKTPQSNLVHSQSPVKADTPVYKATNPGLEPKPKTPTSYVYPEKSPHGILKPGLGSAKKKRVIFAESDDDGSCSDSSTSQLMEIEIDDVPRGTKEKKSRRPSQKVTPLRIRPSPSMKIPASDAFDEAKRNALKPVPRGQTITQQRKVKFQENSGKFAVEESQWHQCYPGLPVDGAKKNKNASQKKEPIMKGCIKKTPNKSYMIKGFGDGKPKAKKKKKNAALSEDDHIPWFDSDSVFGFFDE